MQEAQSRHTSRRAGGFSLSISLSCLCLIHLPIFLPAYASFSSEIVGLHVKDLSYAHTLKRAVPTLPFAYATRSTTLWSQLRRFSFLFFFFFYLLPWVRDKGYSSTQNWKLLPSHRIWLYLECLRCVTQSYMYLRLYFALPPSLSDHHEKLMNYY